MSIIDNAFLKFKIKNKNALKLIIKTFKLYITNILLLQYKINLIFNFRWCGIHIHILAS